MYADMGNWTHFMLRLFSELLQSSQQYDSMEGSRDNNNGSSATMRELCAQSARVLEPMVRCLVDWVKTNGDVEDE